jgi:hypothetical protein
LKEVRLKRICAWCDKEYPSDEFDLDSTFLTHGICPACEAFFEDNEPTSLRGFLNRLEIPVVCVDSDVRVVAASDKACELLGHNANDMADIMGGELVECRWSRLPEGCGRTEHCVGCDIRLAVGYTAQTGKGISRRPVYLDRISEDGSYGRVELLLSTEQRGAVVLLRIDDAD